jgi:hypothetical protein
MRCCIQYDALLYMIIAYLHVGYAIKVMVC